MKKSSCFLVVMMLFLLVGCAKQPGEVNKVTLQDIVSTVSIDFSDRNTEMTIRNKYEYQYNNTYKNTVLNFYNTLNKYKITETENTHNYNDEGIYISFWSFDYENVGFQVYEDNIIRISKDTDFTYYKCDGIYDAIKKDIDALTAEADKYYKIEYSNFLYTYTIFDKNGNTIFKETTSENPHIYIINENTVIKWIQSGTGTLTRGAYFYDRTTGKVSKMIPGQIDWYNGYVCNSMSGAICIQEILGSDEIWIYNNFEQKITDYIENINSVRFINDGKQLEVTYWAENSTEPATQIFDVDKPDHITTYDELYNKI